MTMERFSTNGHYIYDNFHDGEKWLVNEVDVKEIVNVMNNLDTKARERSKALSRLQKENEEFKGDIKGLKSRDHNWGLLYDEAKNKVEELTKENKELKYLLNRTEKELEEYKDFMSLG